MLGIVFVIVPAAPDKLHLLSHDRESPDLIRKGEATQTSVSHRVLRSTRAYPLPTTLCSSLSGEGRTMLNEPRSLHSDRDRPSYPLPSESGSVG